MGPKLKRAEMFEEETFDIKEELNNYKKNSKKQKTIINEKSRKAEKNVKKKLKKNVNKT